MAALSSWLTPVACASCSSWTGPESLDSAFAEIAAFAARCRFRDCRHSAEDGCAVRAALIAGELEDSRWQSYEKLRAEIAWHERQLDPRAAQAQKQKWKNIHKAMRVQYKNDPRHGCLIASSL